jgi:hypothetical protein
MEDTSLGKLYKSLKDLSRNIKFTAPILPKWEAANPPIEIPWTPILTYFLFFSVLKVFNLAQLQTSSTSYLFFLGEGTPELLP